MRLFVAAPAPTEVLHETVRAERFLRARLPTVRARFVPVEQRHLTLAFLGEVAEAMVDAVAEAVGAAAQRTRPFTLRTGGLGAFPDARRARVLWLGLDGAGGAGAAAATLAASLVAGLPPQLDVRADAGPFVPHVTLARVKGFARGPGTPHDRTELAATLAAYDAAAVAWPVTEVVLYASELRAEGALHRALTRAALLPDRGPPAAR